MSYPKDMNDYAYEAHRNSKAHGFWEGEDPTDPHVLAGETGCCCSGGVLGRCAMGDHNARLALVRAHLECARQGYAVHVSCFGECTWSEDTEDYDCHRCEKRVPFGSVCDPPGHDYYESDVQFLLDLIEAERRANAHAIAELCGQVNGLRQQVSDWESAAAMACETPASDCDCPGCSLAREVSNGGACG